MQIFIAVTSIIWFSSIHLLYSILFIIKYKWYRVLNKPISAYPFLTFKYILITDVISDLQNNTILFCKFFRTYFWIGIIKF